ncbi:MAG: FAA hydrolase family protein [Erysipelotrichia bacterium]|nr:FAA hydrolase family protein [Erysipelotrichia bacterium]
MFYRSKEGWKYFLATNKTWIASGYQRFDVGLLDRVTEKSDASEWLQPAEALPAFSGSKILCVGRNYRKHAAELGNEVPARPLWFFKPPSSIIGNGESVILPSGIGRIDYEGELVLVIGRRVCNVAIEDALGCIGGVTVCLDMTARDLQKSDGQWTRAKGFDTFLPLAGLVAPFSNDWKHGSIEVRKNGEVVQKSGFGSMVFGFAELVADISACMTLEPGDLILTGTPEGVGPVSAGDRLHVVIDGPARINLCVECRDH